MGNDTVSKVDSLKYLEEILHTKDLHEGPRALLLLRLCQFGKIFRPDEVERYFKNLEKVHLSLPPDYMDNYNRVKEMFAAPKQKSSSGFTQKIASQVEEAVENARTNLSEGMQKLKDCEQRLQKRWWSFGKEPAWIALIYAWNQFDPEHTLKLLSKVPHGVCEDILNQLNEKSLLSADEWDIPPQKYTIPVILEMLDRDKVTLELSFDLVREISNRLLVDVNAKTTVESEETKIEEKRDKALGKYLKLARLLAEEAPRTTEYMLETLFTALATVDRYGEKWPDRFTQIRQLINIWISYEKLRQDAFSFISSGRTPGYLHDFVLSQWHAMTVSSQEEAAQALDSLRKNSTEKDAAEDWFLVTLVRRGMGKEAMNLAGASSRDRELLSRVRRAWLCEHPESAATAIAQEDLHDDVIGQFLWLGTKEKQVEFLREKTKNGDKTLPSPMWSPPNLSTVVIGLSSSKEDNSLLRLYGKKESPKQQFQVYVRVWGYKNYGHEDIDPLLLRVLVAWDEQHPEEVDSLLPAMWRVMQPDDTLLTLDVLRNAIFERCQTLFAAKPARMQQLFIKWVKKKMVGEGIQRYEAGTTYRVTLKEIVPFLYSILSAQKVLPVSSSRADEIIKYALENYTANEGLITAAAKVYATERGLDAMKPPEKPRNSSFLKDWQLGVVEASTKQILELMIAGKLENLGQ